MHNTKFSIHVRIKNNNNDIYDVITHCTTLPREVEVYIWSMLFWHLFQDL